MFLPRVSGGHCLRVPSRSADSPALLAGPGHSPSVLLGTEEIPQHESQVLKVSSLRGRGDSQGDRGRHH